MLYILLCYVMVCYVVSGHVKHVMPSQITTLRCAVLVCIVLSYSASCHELLKLCRVVHSGVAVFILACLIIRISPRHTRLQTKSFVGRLD